jgi:formate dehydrogenase major subunit
MGAAPCYLPYFRGLDETSEFEKIWEKKLPKKPGLNYREMLEHACKVLYLTEPIPSSIPKKVELLILQGVYPASLMDRADVVLPAAAFTEEDGSFISIEGETRVVKKAAEAGVYPDWKIFSLLAREMGGKGFDYRNVNEIRDEILSLPGEESKEKAGLIPVETTAVEKIGDKGPRVCYRGVDLSEEINDLKAVLESFQRGNKGDE